MMDKEYYTNAGIPPPRFDTMPWSGDQSFVDPTSSLDQLSHFDSAISSMISSPVAAVSNEAFVLRELIGKLGGIGATTAFTSPASVSPFDSCYSTPMSSPPKPHLPILDQMSIPLGNQTSLPPPDPGFAERAAKFSCFGSRSFNGRSSPLGLQHNGELLTHRSHVMSNGKLPRVASSPTLNQLPVSSQTQMETNRKMSKLSANSNEDNSSVSDQIPSGETGSKNETSSKKRKGGSSRGKSKEDPSKSTRGDEEGNAKRSKQTETGKNEAKTEEEEKGNGGSNDESEKQKANNQKPPEPPKDYIHVRARRGQATDSHSLAERVRREKISERMKLLQDLVPGCNKVTGKALMLDEIINYVQSLQRQVEFLSMKLASVNPGLDFNMDTLLSTKDVGTMFQQNAATQPQQMYPLDSSTPAFYSHHQNVQQIQSTTSACRGPLSQCTVDPLSLQLPSADALGESLPQFPAFGEDDLHSIVQMGFCQNLVNFPGNDSKADTSRIFG